MFNYYQPTNIHFGPSRLQEIGQITKKYGNRCLLVSTADEPLMPLYERIKELLSVEEIKVFHFNQVSPNPTTEIIEEGLRFLNENPCDFVLAVGGGSSIDVAKALAFVNGKTEINWKEVFSYDSPFEDYAAYNEKILPIISIPTTSGTGSHVTQASVITKGKDKLSFYHHDLFSKECIVDSELTLTLPNSITAATGFDAFTHAFESYINPRASFYSEMDSIGAMKLIVQYLPKALENPENINYRIKLSLADTLAGRALSNSGADAPHPLSELIGGIVPIPHGNALSVVYPPFIKYGYKKYQEKMDTVASIFNPTSQDLYKELTEFLATIGLNKSLEEYHVDKADFDEMIASPMLDHLPFGNRAFLEKILHESYKKNN